MGNMPTSRPKKWLKKHRKASKQDPFYTNPQWSSFSKQYRKENPMCVVCKKTTINGTGHATDHIIREKRGGHPLDRRNMQTLCNSCHRKKTNKENQGYTYAFTGKYGQRLPIRPLKWIKWA